MDEQRFWMLLQEAHAASAGDLHEQATHLETALARLDASEIASFDRIFREKLRAAYRWDLWAAAYVINGGASDDAFEYFRAFLIGSGQSAYEGALADPDSLADVDLPEDVEAESLLYAAAAAHEAVGGGDLPIAADPQIEPAGESWDEHDVASVVPRLAARYDS